MRRPPICQEFALKKPSRRVALITALAVLLAGAVAVAGYVVWPRASTFERAVAMLPAETLRVTWTDWAGLRDELGEETTYQEMADRDLAVSSLASSADRLEAALGFSPLDAEWELMGQGRDGLVVILKFDDLASVAADFASAGYDRPAENALDGAVWGGTSALVNRLGLSTFELTHVAFLESEGVLIASDQAPFLAEVVEVARGEVDGLDLDGMVPDRDPLVATVFTGDHACEALSMSRADDDARAVATALVEQAGGVSPLRGYLVSLGSGHRITVIFAFENGDQAARNLRPRRVLAGADDPGQGVGYRDLFTLEDAETDGRHVVLSGQASELGYPMSNLTSGPVLLAAC